MRRTVAVLNQKGGVGKTTVTLGLASAADAARRKVLVVDLDPQASSWVLGVDPGGPSVADALATRAAPTPRRSSSPRVGRTTSTSSRAPPTCSVWRTAM
ncbi:MAG: ParA family protein [Ilumatobacteraceae bacterium]